MIEATCAACGTVNRIAEADVPTGAKFVSCTSCKSKVVLPAKAPAAAGPGKPLSIPALPPKLPTPPKGVPSPAAKPVDLADLPTPKRQSPLAGAEASKPAPRSALAGAELPVPKGAAKPPAQQPSGLDLDDLMPGEGPASVGLADLPAPKRPSPLGGSGPKSAIADLPAPKSAPTSAISDLPAPKRATPPAGVPVQAARPADLADLPAPKRATPPAGIPRTPTPTAPRAPTPTAAKAPTPAAPRAPTPGPKAPPPAADLTDLPMPKGGLTDLPAPKPGLTDLPMPKSQAMDSLELEDDLDLPVPKAGITDLPTPKPGGASDLPAPKGFFDDLPQPAKKQGGGIDLPAPKGFFDDLPQPAKPVTTQEVAPKGFFDDLPQPAKPVASQELAPKGLFDGLPQPAKSTGGPPAGGGLFDDLPQPNKPTGGPPAGGGLFDDLPQPNRSAADQAMGAGDIDLGPAAGDVGLELDTSGPELDLGLPLGESPPPGPNAGAAFSDLDLSAPTPPAKPVEEGSPIKIKTPKGGAPQKPIPIVVPAKTGPGAADLKLDLAEDPHDPARTGRPAASTAAKITPKKKAGPSPEAVAAKKKRSQIVLGSLLGIVALGGGGFYFYQRHAKAQAKLDEIDRQLKTADRALKAEDPKHWDRAKSAADKALELDATNVHALGLGAEANIAGALDTGMNYNARVAKGTAMIRDALGAGHTGPELERAQTVAAIAGGQAQRATDLLRVQIGKAPKDGWLQLYMGWAQLAKGDATEAQKAFDQAVALAPATKLPALYGHGKAKLLLADVAGAKSDFTAILQVSKDHVCAQVGLIATYPPSQSVQQVDELKAVLARKDIGVADPRCVVQAHSLIGDVHRLAGRLDMARQSYRDALNLVPNDVHALVGLAAVELSDGKFQIAADLIAKALAARADDPDALLLQTELNIHDGKLPDAEAQIEKLAARKPPLPTLAQAHLAVVRGKLLEAKGQDEDAVAAYAEGAKLAGDLDLTPTMAAVTKLADLTKKATDPAKAAEYRKRADDLLQALAERAQEDAQLSTALGIAYMQAGDPVKAETYLRRAVALKGDDAEAKLQLAKALSATNKTDEAITQLNEAQKVDPARLDIALQLARTYQAANRHDEAVAAFDKLLALPDVPIIVRVDAGRYFARRNMIDKAAAQAEPILKAEPDNPGGMYLKAEGLLKADKSDEASPILVKATDIDPDAQYLDALGRAQEARWNKSADRKYIEGARFAYERASKSDPKMFHPWLGQGKMLVENASWDAAIKPLLAASAIDKTNAEVMFYTGYAYYGLRNKDPNAKKVGAQWLESSLKARPELDLATRAKAYNLLGDLYQDLNKPQDNVRVWENAVKLGEELEKQSGKAPEWLTETYYELGDQYRGMNNCSAQKRAWQRYQERASDKEKASIRFKSVVQQLLTALKSC